MPLTKTRRLMQPGFGQDHSDGTPHVLARDEWNYTKVDLGPDAAQVISSAPAVLGAIYVDTVLSAHACPLLDGAVTVFSLPASLAAGTWVDQCKGMRFETNLQIDSNDAATGNLVVMWRPI